MKRTAVVFLMVAVLFALTPFAGGQTVYAGDSLDKAGDNIATGIDGSYKEITLRLIDENAPGYMYDFEGTSTPWAADSYTIEEVYIQEGIKNISRKAFSDMPSLKEIWIPRSVTEIKPNALEKLPALETIWYSGTWAQLTALKNSIPKGSSARTIIENADWQCTDRGSKEYTLRLDDFSGGPYIRVTDYDLNIAILDALDFSPTTSYSEQSQDYWYVDFNNDQKWDMTVEQVNGNWDIIYCAFEGGMTGLVMDYKLAPERGQYFYDYREGGSPARGVPFYQKLKIMIPTEIQSSNVKLDGTSFPYAGYALTPGVTVTCGGKQLKEGTDFTASYSNNKEIGTATVTVTGKGNYYGTVSKSFNIIAKTCNIKNLWASQHMNGAVLFKWTKESSFTPSGWEVHYRTKKIGGGSWSGWTTKSFGAGTYQYKCPVKADYVVEIHARAKGDKSWSQGIITTPAGGKYQAMKTVYVKNAATNKRVDSITLKVGQSVKLKPDYVYPVTDYKKRPRLYPTQALWDLDVNGKGMLAIKKPDGSAYTGGMIDGAATITGRRAGTTNLICRAPNGRTKVLKVTVTP